MRAFPEEFRRDVVEIARRSREPRKEIAEDFGISPETSSNWLKADIDDGVKLGITSTCSADLREANQRIRLEPSWVL